MSETYKADSTDSTTSTGDATHEQDVTYYADDQKPKREAKVIDSPASGKSTQAETK